MYRWVEHTAELELAIEAGDEAGVFADALAALSELLGGAGGEDERRSLTAEGRDRATLLASWLEELVYLAEADGFVPARAESLSLSGDALEATVLGVRGAPPPLVKAVTYHRLSFAPAGSGYVATVVLDV